MKVKNALIILLIGFCIGTVGGVMKIFHFAGADTLMAAGLVLQVTGVLLFLLKLLQHPKGKSFLNG
jgi:hypothetical protein